MNYFGLIALVVSGALTLHAQTNAAGRLSTPRGPTFISSATADFDLAGHEAVYRGHVQVDDPQMKLTCEKLIADVPAAGGHVNHIVAETNVVIDFLDDKGETNHATSDQAVYVYSEQGGVTNETVTLTGHPQMENAQSTLTGDVIVWDRLNNRMTASNQKMILHQSLIGPAQTNAAPARPAPAPVMLPGPDTNQP